MKAFMHLYMDELLVLLSKVEIELDFEDYNDPKDPYTNINGEPGYGVTAQVGPAFMYGWGRTPEKAFEDFSIILIDIYEMYKEDADKVGGELWSAYTFYRDSVIWWMDNFHLIKISVPDGFEDMDDRMWEIWEEWYRKYDPDHIPFMLDSDYDWEDEDMSGRKMIK
jgi:hypothetical protein